MKKYLYIDCTYRRTDKFCVHSYIHRRPHNSINEIRGHHFDRKNFRFLCLVVLLHVFLFKKFSFFLRFHRINVLVHKRVILEEAMAWLSTLGGGFSSLGDHFSDAVSSNFLVFYLPFYHCFLPCYHSFSLCRNSSSSQYDRQFPFTSQAEIAGSISVRQMTVAMEMGDPVIQAKCRLWFAQSRMQIGDFKTAAQVIRWQRCLFWGMIIVYAYLHYKWLITLVVEISSYYM